MSAAADKKFSVWKLIVIVIAALIAATAVVLAIIVAVAANSVTHPKKIIANTRPSELGLIHTAYEIEAPDGAVMLGWFIPAQKRDGEREDITESDTTVIFSHSADSNKILPEICGIYYARYLVENGYNVMLFDYSGSGVSTGSGYTFGVRETEELKSVISYVYDKIGSKHIVLQGFGYGASAAIAAGCEDGRVEAIIADSPYIHLSEVFSAQLSNELNLPAVLTSCVPFFVQLSQPDIYSLDIEKSLRTAENKSFCFLQGETSEFGNDTVYRLEAFVDKDKNAATHYVFDGANFYYGFMVQEENYAAAVLEFLSSLK